MRTHPERSLVLALLLCTALAAAQEGGSAPEGASARVHDHVAFTFRAPDGMRSPAERAAEASRNLNAVIDEHVPGELTITLRGTSASVDVGARQMFRLVPADALADGASDLSDYVPRVHAQLSSFLSRERRRAQLQRGVLSFSLVVFFGLLAYLFLRLVHRWTRAWEKRLLEGGNVSRFLAFGFSSERTRGIILVVLAGARLLVSGAVVYVFLLVSLSLFERTESFRNQLASWVTTPLAALGERLLHGIPNVVLLLVLFVVLRGGWRGLALIFERAALKDARVPGVRRSTLLPLRLLARAALVVAALLLIPLVTGYEGDLFTRVGFVLLGGLALGSLPLVAAVTVGTYFLIRQEYALGEWLVVRHAGEEIAGEVTSVDFLHLRIVPVEGGEVRIPHLSALWSPVVHLPHARPLSVQLEIPRSAGAIGPLLDALKTATNELLGARGLPTAAEVQVVALERDVTRVNVRAGEATDTLRSELLLALSRALAPRSELAP